MGCLLRLRLASSEAYGTMPAWAAPGDVGPVVMPLDEALTFTATEGFFWIRA